MNTLDLRDAVENISLQNEIEKSDIIEILQEVIADEFSEYLNILEDHLVVEVDDDMVFKLYIKKEIVETVEDDMLELTQAEASEYAGEQELGANINVPVDFSILERRNIKRFNSILTQKLKNIHKLVLYKEYKSREGQLIQGTFLRKNHRDIFLDIGKTEVRLPYREQNPKEFYNQGDKIRVYLKEVSLDENNRLGIVVSRIDPNLVKRLFELEVPEVADGVVKIKTIVREPGYKVKMTVYSTKVGVEPVGACVGLSGVRIQEVIKELGGERIDVLPFNNNTKELLARSLQPAKVERSKVLIVNEEDQEALVVVNDEDYPRAIGKGGVNYKLACRLTGWKMNIKTESQIMKNPEILQIFNRAEELFSTSGETDLNQLTEIDEELIVRLMNAGIMTISDLYEKKLTEIAAIEGIGSENAQLIRKTLDEMVEVVETESDVEAAQQEYLNEFEDELQGVETEEKFEEEIQHVEYLVCPNCNFEFEYTNQTHCPSCNIEFEFEEEVEEIEEVVEE